MSKGILSGQGRLRASSRRVSFRGVHEGPASLRISLVVQQSLRRCSSKTSTPKKCTDHHCEKEAREIVERTVVVKRHDPQARKGWMPASEGARPARKYFSKCLHLERRNLRERNPKGTPPFQPHFYVRAYLQDEQVGQQKSENSNHMDSASSSGRRDKMRDRNIPPTESLSSTLSCP